FPSLHSAIPWLITLSAFKAWKKKALPILIFPVMVWFSAVYLGEHYVIDVAGGIFYATLASIAAYNKDRIIKARCALGGNVADLILGSLGRIELPIYRKSEQMYALMVRRALW
ncbi:MAG: phosphatase PAP2 family protein, partial [Candidatus Bathyarchaeia archaeon]